MKRIYFTCLITLFSLITFSQSTFVGLVLQEIDNGGLVEGTTYRLYAEINGGLVYSVNTASIQSTEDFYQNPGGADVQSSVSEFFLSMVPELHYDTWLTIGDSFGPDATSLSPSYSLLFLPTQ